MGLNLKDAIQHLRLSQISDHKTAVVEEPCPDDRSSFLRPNRVVDVRGYVVEFLSARPSGFKDQVFLKSIIPPGVCTPRQSQTEPQSLLILSGRMEVLSSNVWRTWSEGETLCLAANQRYALRNLNSQKVVTILVTTPAMARFLEDAGQPLAADAVLTPPIDDWRRYLDAVRRHGHWVEDAGLPDPT